MIVNSGDCELKSEPFLVTEIGELSTGQNIAVYPNPAADYIEVNLGNMFGDNLSISITDVNGKVYFADEMNSPSKSINVKNFPSGVYIIVVTDPESSYRLRIVKL
jgi:hypothetical protein